MKTYRLSAAAPDYLRHASLAHRLASRDSAPCRIAGAGVGDPDGPRFGGHGGWHGKTVPSLEEFRKKAGALLHGPDIYRGSK